MCGCQSNIASFAPTNHAGLQLYTKPLASLQEPERSLPIPESTASVKQTDFSRLTLFQKPVMLQESSLVLGKQPKPMQSIPRTKAPAVNERKATTTAQAGSITPTEVKPMAATPLMQQSQVMESPAASGKPSKKEWVIGGLVAVGLVVGVIVISK